MDVLVIGGSQFVGRHIVEELLAQGHGVTVLNRGVTADELPAEVRRLRADRNDTDQVLSVLEGLRFDAVVDCIGYRSATIEPLVERFAGQIRRFVFISSSSVYRPSEQFPIDEACALNEDTDWEYALEKIRSEQALARAGEKRGFPWVSLRPGYIYGPYNGLADGELRLMAQAEQGRAVVIPGDGSFIFHMIHARDLAHAAIASIARDEANGGIYNILGAHAQTANRLVEAVAEATEREIEVRHAPQLTRRSETVGFFWYQTRPTQIYSIEAARRDLGWEPRFDLVEGFRDTYRWYRESGFAESHQYDFSRDDEVLASL